jgi:hypothetical protein
MLRKNVIAYLPEVFYEEKALNVKPVAVFTTVYFICNL